MRKACESSAITAHHEIPENAAKMIQSHLVKEVSRCSHMLRIADNDFSRIREAAAELDSDPVNLPMNVYEVYLDTMDERTRANESYFMFLYAYMLGYMEHIRNGIAIADGIESGDNPVSYAETLTLSRIREIYEACGARCRELDGIDDTVPYEDALDYIECALEEISIILRVATGKDVELEEISDHMEWSESLDSTPFRNLFMLDMDPEDMAMIENFEVGWERRVDIMVG